ncbi:MAG: glycerophosphodiester phosphodiesterase [Anaerolineae bacterium]
MPLALPGKPKPYVIAHRGNSAAAPENTLAAFRRAIDDGADIIETDLHLTRDNAFVCIHDATLDRTTGGRGAVADLTLAEIKRYSASYGRPEFGDERIPALDELTSILPPDVFLALELKTDRFLEPDVACCLIDQLRAAGVFNRTAALSFSLDRVLAVQRAAPEIPIGFITLTRLAPTVPTQLISPFWPLLLINPCYALWAHRRGRLIAPLDPWPDGRLWLYRLLRCDAILTNDPARTLKQLGRTTTK